MLPTGPSSPPAARQWEPAEQAVRAAPAQATRRRDTSRGRSDRGGHRGSGTRPTKPNPTPPRIVRDGERPAQRCWQISWVPPPPTGEGPTVRPWDQGVMVTEMLEARQLFASLVSTTLPRSSAQARRKYVLGGVDVGTVTVTVPDWLAPDARPGTARFPVRSVSPALLTLPSER